MIRLGFFAGIFLAAVSFSSAARSQPVGVPIASPVIGGVQVFCTLPNGAPVFTVFANAGDAGKAGIFNGVPVIYIHPFMMGQHWAIQRFLYAHECMHHRLGHSLGVVYMQMEIHADCEAIRMLRQQNLVNSQAVQIIASGFAGNSGFPPFYPPGPQRAQNILNCYAS